MITIHPDYQRKGYGRKLLEYSFEFVQKFGDDTIAIFGNPENYACYGFKNCKKYYIYFIFLSFDCIISF